MCTSLLTINTHHTRKSFTILADDEYDSMSDRFDSKNTNLPVIAHKIKSVYHQNCIIPNEDFSILYNSITSKLQPPSYSTFSNKPSYSPSKEFFNKVSSKLRDLRPPKVDPQPEESKEAKMERPMFITTVKSGTFLEPPPEVAALLGLRKNSFSNTNSSNSSTAKTQNDANMVYSFASKPRILKSNLHTNFASRSLFRVETRKERRETLNEPLPKITNDTSDGGAPSYGNTMFDRRVARGSNFAAQRPNVISTEHVLSRQAEARRRAAVRQRAQIRARKLRLGTPPPIDGRRHGQIQTDKFLEELTERPPDKSIACQADLPVQHNSPVYYLDSNTTTGVEAETQIYPGDLPEIDDELPSVVSSIVNKILQEAILEINDEIEVIRLRTLASEKRNTAANSSPNDETGVITKAQLHMLIQQAVNELRQTDQSDSNNKNFDNINDNQFLEKIFDEIKNMVTDVKFLTGIIKTQLENWSEDSNQNNEGESEQVETEQTDEESNAPETKTDNLRRETLSAADESENQPADEDLQQMDAEIDDYKTDDFEEESKDLVDGDNEENEIRDKRDLVSDQSPITDDNLDTNEADNRSNVENELSQPVLGENIGNDDDTNEQDFVDVDRSTEFTQNRPDSETAVTDREVPNDSQPQIIDRQNSLSREPLPVIISEHVEDTTSSTEQESSQRTNDLKVAIEEPNKRTESVDEETAEPTTTDASLQNNETDDSNQNNTKDDDNQSSENPTSTHPSTLTIPTMNESLLDPPINDSNSENDIVIKDTLENQTESDVNQSTENTPAVTVPTMNLSLLDPPVKDVENDDQNENIGSAEEISTENQTNSSNRGQNVTNNDENEANDSNNGSSSNNDQTSGSNDEQNEDNLSNNSNDNATKNEQTSISNEEQNTSNNQNDEGSDSNNGQITNTDETSSPTAENPTSNDQNVTNNDENSTPTNDSNEKQTPADNQAPTETQTKSNISNDQSSETPVEPERVSVNEDNSDVVSVQKSAEESSTAKENVTLQNTESEATSANDETTETTALESNSINAESETTLDNVSAQNEPKDSPPGNNNNQTTTDDVSERTSTATIRSDTIQEKSSDTESVENNELQSNTSRTSENFNNLSAHPRNQSIDDNTSQDSDKPLNAENDTSQVRDNNSTKSSQSGEGTTEETNQPEPATSEENPETVSIVSSADSRKTFDISTETTPLKDTLAGTENSNPESSEPLVNGDSTSEPDNELSTQTETDIDARNNNELESRGTNKSIETNNDDSVIQSKNPTIVQNGNIMANS